MSCRNGSNWARQNRDRSDVSFRKQSLALPRPKSVLSSTADLGSNCRECPVSALIGNMCAPQHRSLRAQNSHSLRNAPTSAIGIFGSFIGLGPRCSDHRKLCAGAPHRRVKRGVVEAGPICAVFFLFRFSKMSTLATSSRCRSRPTFAMRPSNVSVW